MTQPYTARYNFVRLLLAIVFLCLFALFSQLWTDAHNLTLIPLRSTLETAIMLTVFKTVLDAAIVLMVVPFLLANVLLLFAIGEPRVFRRVVYLSETPKLISINAGSPGLYLKAFIGSIGDRKGNASEVARELRDATVEAIKMATMSKKAIVLTSPLLNKPTIQTWLYQNKFTETKQAPWFMNILLWIVFGPTIASIALFTGNMYIGAWQTWTRP